MLIVMGWIIWFFVHGRADGRREDEYWDATARSRSQNFYTWVWLLGFFPIGLLLAIAPPEGRYRRYTQEQWEAIQARREADQVEEAEARGVFEAGIERLRSLVPELSRGPVREAGEAYLRAYDADGLTPEVAELGLRFNELAELERVEIERELARRGLDSTGVPEVGRRDYRGEPWNSTSTPTKR